MIKFSVVIPLYNKEKDIAQTIKSVLNQNYKADEIIVVDDGSTDNGVKVVQKIFEDKVKVVSQKNLGVSMARNRGMDKAKNEYICLLDGDDLWEENFLEEIQRLITNYPDALFYSTAHKYIDEKGNVVKGKVSFSREYTGLIENFIETFSNNYALVNSSSVCVKKSSGVLFPKNEKKGEDICVWLRLGLKGSLAFSAKPLSIYRLNASNRSATVHKEAILPCPIKWFYENQQELKEHKQYKSLKKFIYTNIFIIVYGGFSLSKNYVSIDAVIQLMKKNRDLFYILLYPAYLVPVGLLEFIKKIRRRLR